MGPPLEAVGPQRKDWLDVEQVWSETGAGVGVMKGGYLQITPPNSGSSLDAFGIPTRASMLKSRQGIAPPHAPPTNRMEWRGKLV